MQAEAGTVNLARPSHWGGHRPRAAGQFVLGHILAHNRARLQPRVGLDPQLHPQLSVGVSAPGSRFPASRTKSQINFHVILMTQSLVFCYLKRNQTSSYQHATGPALSRTLLCGSCVLGFEDPEDAEVSERGWDIPETVSQLGNEQAETSPKRFYSLPAVERLRVPGRHGAIPGISPQQ